MKVPKDMVRDRISHAAIEFYDLVRELPAVTYEEAAERIGVSVNHVRRIEGELVDKGYLEVISRKNASGKVVERNLLDRS